MSRPNLEVQVGTLNFSNPVLSASGTFGYGIEEQEAARLFGGIVTKTITLESRAGNPPPRIVETPGGILNSIGLQNVGVEQFMMTKLPQLRDLAVPILVSIGGRKVGDYEGVVDRLEHSEGISGYELNISCPNVSTGGLEFSQSPSAAEELVRKVRRRTRRPVWVKLSPNVTSIGALAHVCEDAGADAVTAVNTFVGMAVDLESRRPCLPGGTGGLSGPAIRPLALARVREIVCAVSIPVIGVGGIATGEDALEFLLIGARAVQVGTANFLRPDQGGRVVEETADRLKALGVASVVDFIGSLQGEGG